MQSPDVGHLMEPSCSKPGPALEQVLTGELAGNAESDPTRTTELEFVFYQDLRVLCLHLKFASQPCGSGLRDFAQPPSPVSLDVHVGFLRSET